MFSDAEMGAPQSDYVVLARKYRPRVFADLIGQGAMVATLSNAFKSGRIAQGYMLTGVRGVGKTTTARILARALNFEKDGVESGPTVDLPSDPQDYGRHCAEIMESRHADVIEMDAASNTGVDNIREIIESARYKVFIIDEVHMLSKGAFNALLKTLEEPPGHVKFIFATTEIRKVPVTVLSRCQRFDLRRVDIPDLTAHFAKIVEKEGAEADPEALKLVARAAEGSVRDGLSILDQAIAFSEGKVTAPGVRDMLGLADRGRIFDLMETVFSGDTAASLAAWDKLHADGADPLQALSDLAEAVHVTTRIKVAGAASSEEVMSADEIRRASSFAENLSMPLLARAWQMLLKGLDETARAPDPRAAAEMVLIRLAYTADLPSPDEIMKALGGAPPASRSGKGQQPAHQGGSRAADAPLARAPREHTAPPPTEPKATARAPAPAGGPRPPWEDDGGEADDAEDPDPAEFEIPLPPDGEPLPQSFSEVLALIGRRRDAKLKVYLEEHTSLVRFDAKTRSIDLYLYPEAPRELPNDLREKLKDWTGANWVVMLSKQPGERPVAEVRREREAAELEKLKSFDSVREALAAFPDAEIVAVHDLDSAASEDDDDRNTGRA